MNAAVWAALAVFSTASVSTTDAGADEVGTRAGIHLATASNVFLLFFDSDCVEHQNHIINHDVLVDMDDILKLFALLGRPGKCDRYSRCRESARQVLLDSRENYAQLEIPRAIRFSIGSRKVRRPNRGQVLQVTASKTNLGAVGELHPLRRPPRGCASTDPEMRAVGDRHQAHPGD